VTDPNTVLTVDIDAIQDAVEALDDADVAVTDVERVQAEDDGHITFDLSCRAERRTADVTDFSTDGGDG